MFLSRRGFSVSSTHFASPERLCYTPRTAVCRTLMIATTSVTRRRSMLINGPFSKLTGLYDRGLEAGSVVG